MNAKVSANIGIAVTGNFGAEIAKHVQLTLIGVRVLEKINVFYQGITPMPVRWKPLPPPTKRKDDKDDI